MRPPRGARNFELPLPMPRSIHNSSLNITQTYIIKNTMDNVVIFFLNTVVIQCTG